MANTNDITKILRDKAAGRKNIIGDYWSDDWCENAANEIDRLRAEVQKLENDIDDIYLERAGEDA